jgi:hypothetical protein
MNTGEKTIPELAQMPFDALPDPEPAAPSLPEPDPGVYHHTPASLPEENKE